jgi:hypothetical protein
VIALRRMVFMRCIFVIAPLRKAGEHRTADQLPMVIRVESTSYLDGCVVSQVK